MSVHPHDHPEVIRTTRMPSSSVAKARRRFITDNYESMGGG
jgi:hypothetical protein